MRRAKDIIGLPVVTLDSGKCIAEVLDILFEPEENRILALVVDRGRWLTNARGVPFNAVHSIGEDAVVVPSRKAIWRAKADPKVERAWESKKVVSELDVYTSDGDFLGKIADIDIDEKTGQVQGYEVRLDGISETQRGEQFLPAPETEQVGFEMAFVPPETGDRIEQQAAREAEGRVAMIGGPVRTTISSVAIARQKQYAVGKRARSTVTAPDGTVIVLQGETITEAEANEAEQQGVLGWVVCAAGGGEARGLGERLSEGIVDTLDRARRSLGELAGMPRKQAEKRRIYAALGRPVKRAILDQYDGIILNTGGIVTHQSIDLARQARVLDILLDSVSKREPELIMEQEKAPPPGESRSTEGEQQRREAA